MSDGTNWQRISQLKSLTGVRECVSHTLKEQWLHWLYSAFIKHNLTDLPIVSSPPTQVYILKITVRFLTLKFPTHSPPFIFLQSLNSHAVGIQTVFHCTAFLHISSKIPGWVQSFTSPALWRNRVRVFMGLVHVCCRYWQPWGRRQSEISDRALSLSLRDS